MAAAVPVKGGGGREAITHRSGQGTRTCPLGTRRILPAPARLRLAQNQGAHRVFGFPQVCSHRLSLAWVCWDKQTPNGPVPPVTAEG